MAICTATTRNPLFPHMARTTRRALVSPCHIFEFARSTRAASATVRPGEACFALALGHIGTALDRYRVRGTHCALGAGRRIFELSSLTQSTISSRFPTTSVSVLPFRTRLAEFARSVGICEEEIITGARCTARRGVRVFIAICAGSISC